MYFWCSAESLNLFSRKEGCGTIESLSLSVSIHLFFLNGWFDVCDQVHTFRRPFSVCPAADPPCFSPSNNARKTNVVHDVYGHAAKSSSQRLVAG